MKFLVRVLLYGEYYAGYRVSNTNASPIDQRILDTASRVPDLQGNTLHIESNAYFLRPFLKELLDSPAFRKNLKYYSLVCLNYPTSRTLYLNIILNPADQEIIDYRWNELMLDFIWSRVEIENAFSWLSTLGGAFSALGDYFERFAKVAGKISIRQLQLSVILGDEGLAARSRLYSSLALAQQGQLKLARKVVRSVADFARTSKDRRLMRMCQGVWAKLRYLRKLKNAKTGNGKGDVNEQL